ncbi:P-loop ATPase, Sll1717 family [Micrococcus luteus]|uniref:P-loop ATPase, Sll1717 family n=1 Tax=Micrococcus luteus TaxID=1270 RepID=UPI001D0C38CB|nr:hypothetical protein [Micrococcus luteus]MCC0766256.1 hypothetical protein [Micrococcus luteus]
MRETLAPRPAFSEFYFGSEDPYNEVRDDRMKFIRSFVDPNDKIDKIVNGRLTLILGPKGTGKSALAYYLGLTGQPNGSGRYIAQTRTADNLPLSDIPALKTGQVPGRQRTASAWRFILLANYLDVALSDTEVRVRGIRDIKRILGILKDAGFMAGGSGRALAQFLDQTFTLPTDKAGSLFKSIGKTEVSIFDLIPSMTNWAKDIRSSNRHLLLLDGLDSIFLSDSEYDESLAGLMQAASSLNRELSESSATGSIVLLLRNDVFHRVSLLLTDAHKQRANAYDLDWRTYSYGNDNTGPLIRLLNQKARQGVSADSDVDVLEYFPVGMGHSKNRKNRSTLRYLMNFTRHTPRDLLQLMEAIREEAERRNLGPGETLPESVVREGIDQYSSKYFISSLRGEFVGYHGGVEAIEGALRALKLVPNNDFTRFDYAESVRTHAPDYADDVDEFLRLFFRAGAVANLRNGTNGSRELVFHHRRDDVEPDLKGVLTMHSALIRAWSRGRRS